MIKEFGIPIVVFAIGLNTLILGKKNPLQTTLFNVLALSFITSLLTQAMIGVLIASMFLPLIYFGKNSLVRSKKVSHSTTQEKASVYMGLLPGFGLYFLFREKLEGSLSTLHIKQEVLESTEIALVFFLLLFFALSIRKRSWR